MRQVIEHLKNIGAVKIRSKNHDVYQLPNGRRFAMPQSASDQRAEQNALHELKGLLGEKDYTFRDGERREKKRTGGRSDQEQYEKVDSIDCRCMRCQLKTALKIEPLQQPRWLRRKQKFAD